MKRCEASQTSLIKPLDMRTEEMLSERLIWSYRMSIDVEVLVEMSGDVSCINVSSSPAKFWTPKKIQLLVPLMS